MRSSLTTEGLRVGNRKESDQRLYELRQMYEPYLYSLSERLKLPLPLWILEAPLMEDNWQISAWGPTPSGIGHF